MDFDYHRGTNRFIRNSSFEIQDDLRELTQTVMQMPPLCGCFWVLEWTKTNAIHAHAIFYLKGQKHQKSFPFIQQIGDLWLKITNDERKYERCKPKDCYQDNINNVVDYYNDEDVKSLRRIASYLTKESQKNGYLIWDVMWFLNLQDRAAPEKQNKLTTLFYSTTGTYAGVGSSNS
ncbi:hypothetical protein ACFVF4_000650 [Enterobacter hormaechei]